MKRAGFASIAVLMLAVASAATTGACADDKSGLMLAITTDMKAPKDVNAVSVTVSTNNTIKHNVVGRVTPQGDILLPATLAIAEPDDPNASIRIRVMAFQERRARVLRDVRTSIPSGGRVALLRIPLNFVNDGSTKGELPAGALPAPNPGTATSSSGGPPSGGVDGGPGDGGSSAGSGGGSGGGVAGGDLFDPFTFVPNCENPEETWIDGECKDAYIDPATLPDYDEALVGRSDQAGSCFDVRACFGEATIVGAPPGELGADRGEEDRAEGEGQGTGDLDFRPRAVTLDRASCTLDLGGADATSLNLAFVTPDVGECLRPGQCYVPLDSGGAGWTADGGKVTLPPYVCRLLESKHLQLAHSTGCAAKKESNPICADTPSAPGAVTDASAPPLGNAMLVVPEPFATSVVAESRGGDALYLAGSNRVARVVVGQPAQPIENIELAGPLPWTFGATPAFRSGFILTNGTNTAYASTEGPAERLQLPSGVQAVASMFGQTEGGGFFFAATGVNGGVYRTEGGDVPAQKVSFSPRAIDDATAIAPTQSGFIYGTASGVIAGCDALAQFCGVENRPGGDAGGRVDAIASHPDNPQRGYALLAGGLYRSDVVNPETGELSATRIAEGAFGGATIEGRYYPRALAADSRCVFFSSPAGVHWAADDGAGGLLFAAPPDPPVLGVALGGGKVYFTVFAPMEKGGGLYAIDPPPACRATDRGGDDGRGGERAPCTPDGQGCAEATECCSGFCGPDSECIAP